MKIKEALLLLVKEAAKALVVGVGFGLATKIVVPALESGWARLPSVRLDWPKAPEAKPVVKAPAKKQRAKDGGKVVRR